jgi:hypothetical protein
LSLSLPLARSGRYEKWKYLLPEYRTSDAQTRGALQN